MYRVHRTALSVIWASCAIGFTQVPANIRVDSSLVLVPVTVTDPASRYVLGLEKQHFRIFEDDAEQKIAQDHVAAAIGVIWENVFGISGEGNESAI